MIALVLALSLTACGGDARQPRTEQPEQPEQPQQPQQPAPGGAGLHARFERAELEIESSTSASLVMIVENRGSTPRTIDLDMLGSAIFAIEVIASDGRRVLTIPPGMPPANYTPRTEALAPGASHRFEMTLHVFSPPLPDGTYTVRARDIPSDTLRLIVDD